MPGKRMIDESICRDRRLNAVSEGAENLFYRLLTKTDDLGNVFAEPDLIEGEIYQRRPGITIQMIQERLCELNNAKDKDNIGLIDLYHYNGEIYANLPAFQKHQKLRTDIKPKVTYPLRSVSKTLRSVSNPFHPDVQEKIKQNSKKTLPEQDVSGPLQLVTELKQLRGLYPNKSQEHQIKSILKHMGFNESEIEEAFAKEGDLFNGPKTE